MITTNTLRLFFIRSKKSPIALLWFPRTCFQAPLSINCCVRSERLGGLFRRTSALRFRALSLTCNNSSLEQKVSVTPWAALYDALDNACRVLCDTGLCLAKFPGPRIHEVHRSGQSSSFSLKDHALFLLILMWNIIISKLTNRLPANDVMVVTVVPKRLKYRCLDCPTQSLTKSALLISLEMVRVTLDTTAVFDNATATEIYIYFREENGGQPLFLLLNSRPAI